MLRYPRIEVIKRTIYVPIYRESYEVQTMRPNRPMQSKFGMSKTQANAYSKRMLALLKKEGYDKAIFKSVLIDLRKFVLWNFHAPICLIVWERGFFGGAYRPTPWLWTGSFRDWMSRTLSVPVRRGRFHLPARHRKKLPKAEGQRFADTTHIVGYRLLTPFLHSGISLLPYSYFHIVI